MSEVLLLISSWERLIYSVEIDRKLCLRYVQNEHDTIITAITGQVHMFVEIDGKLYSLLERFI